MNLEIKDVPVDHILPNPWNPNFVPVRVDEAIRESIGVYGMVDPITCRIHPTQEGFLEVLDGEHRLEAVKEMGHQTIPVVILPLENDAQAKRFTIIANETRGYAQKDALAQLLREIDEELGTSSRLGLPYYEDEFKDLIQWADDAAKDVAQNHPTPSHELVLIVKHPEEGGDTLLSSIRDFLEDRFPSAEVSLRG